MCTGEGGDFGATDFVYVETRSGDLIIDPNPVLVDASVFATSATGYTETGLPINSFTPGSNVEVRVDWPNGYTVTETIVATSGVEGGQAIWEGSFNVPGDYTVTFTGQKESTAEPITLAVQVSNGRQVVRSSPSAWPRS